MDEQIREIGLGLIFDPNEFVGYMDNQEGRFVKLKIPKGIKYTYYTIGAWKGGYNVPPLTGGAEWNENLSELAKQLKSPVSIKFETLKSNP